MKYDAVAGHWQTRILQGVSKEALDDYCAEHGMRVVADRAIGLVYREAVLVKDARSYAASYADEVNELHGSA